MSNDAHSTKESKMKKSYIENNTLEINIKVELGEIHALIEELTPEEGDELGYRGKSLLKKLEEIRREAVEDARRQFEHMAEFGS